MQKVKIKTILHILFAVALFSCSDNDLSVIPQVENGNYSIYVSNQSSTLDPVDLTIMIDGKLAIKQEFYFENGETHIRFQFQIEDGDHKLSVSSIKGNISKDTTFTPQSTPYCSISFWYEPAYNGYKEVKDISIRLLTIPPLFANNFTCQSQTIS